MKLYAAFALVPVAALALAACGGETPPAATAASAASSTSGAASTGAGASKDATLPKPADHPESDKVSWKKDASPKSCHSSAKAGDLVTAVTAMATGCVGAQSMHQVGQPTTGEGAASTATMVKQIPLQAKANHCYRVFGLAEASVTDFDIAVMDSAGKSAGEDLTDSNDAITLEDGAICFKADDTASVNTAVAAGSGKWAVEVWSD